MQHHETAYELEGLDDLDRQLVLELEYARPSYRSYHWNGEEEDDSVKDNGAERPVII